MQFSKNVIFDNLIKGQDPYVYQVKDFTDYLDIIHTVASVRVSSRAGVVLSGEYDLFENKSVSNIKFKYNIDSYALSDLELKEASSFLRSILVGHGICSGVVNG